MKKVVVVIFCISTLIAGNGYAGPEYFDMVKILEVLMPKGMGDTAFIDQKAVTTNNYLTRSASDGTIHIAYYKDGVVTTIISTTGPKKYLGEQRIFRNGKEDSSSKEFMLDENNPDTIIHVHKKYIVYTSPKGQTIEPRSTK